MNNLCCIIIPIHKELLSDDEYCSINNTISLMYLYDIYFVCPKSIKEYYENFAKKYQRNNIYVKCFNDFYFESTNNYSLLCLSEFFYEAFFDYTYMLICQQDAWIFYDNLKYFCEKNYDYLGALVLMSDQKINDIESDKISKFWHLLNGGFSLRHNQHFYNACKLNREIVIKSYFDDIKTMGFLNEDMIVCGPDFIQYLNVPIYDKLDLKTIFTFSAETRCDEIYPYLNDKLPFGCHTLWAKNQLINIFNKNNI